MLQILLLEGCYEMTDCRVNQIIPSRPNVPLGVFSFDRVPVLGEFITLINDATYRVVAVEHFAFSLMTPHNPVATLYVYREDVRAIE